jgi:hypothetical protein
MAGAAIVNGLRAIAAAAGVTNLALGPLALALAGIVAAYMQWKQLSSEVGGAEGLAAFASGGFAGLDEYNNRKAKEEAARREANKPHAKPGATGSAKRPATPRPTAVRHATAPRQVATAPSRGGGNGGNGSIVVNNEVNVTVPPGTPATMATRTAKATERAVRGQNAAAHAAVAQEAR